MFAAMGLALVVTGCGGRASSGVVTRDSAGVVIVDNQAPEDGAGVRFRIDSAPVVDIGGGDPHAEFPQGVTVVRLRSGQIVVAVRKELRWFDARGGWIRTVGRDGSGPGEFRQIDLIAPVGDSLLVYDFGLRRISAFDSAGRYGRGQTLVDPDTLGETFPVGVLSDSRLLLATYHTPPPVNGLRRDPVTLRIATAAGQVTATLGSFPYVEQLVESGRDGVSMGRALFGKIAYWATLDTMVLVATNERFSFDWYRPNGTAERSVRRAWVPVPVTAADVTRQVEEWLGQFPAGMEERKRSYAARWMSSPRPEAKPPYGRVLVSAAGEVWAEEYGEPGRRSRPATYSVFDRSGRWLARVAMPAGAEPAVIGTRDIVAIWLNADDVAHIRVYPLQRMGH